MESEKLFGQFPTFETDRLILRQMTLEDAAAFEQLGLNRLEARCNASNVGSYKVMEKLGLTLEGILRKQLIIKGTFTDQRMYAILKEDYYHSGK